MYVVYMYMCVCIMFYVFMVSVMCYVYVYVSKIAPKSVKKRYLFIPKHFRSTSVRIPITLAMDVQAWKSHKNVCGK